jgi:hypothetical protein
MLHGDISIGHGSPNGMLATTNPFYPINYSNSSVIICFNKIGQDIVSAGKKIMCMQYPFYLTP